MDVELCEACVQRFVNGEEKARNELVAHLWPFWLSAIATNRSMGAYRSSEDHIHNVAVALAVKLGAPDSDALNQYRAWRAVNPEKNFGDWMRIVLANAVRDYVRAQLGSRRATADEPSPKQLLNEFAAAGQEREFGVRPPFTDARTARELLEFARNRLDPIRLRILEMWLVGETPEHIQATLQLPDDDARKLLRATLAVLRRHFAEGTGDASSGHG